MNKIFIFTFLVLTTQINCQSKSINDLAFSNFVGKPKKITELTTSSGNILDKSISFYSNDGYLIKVEYYNLSRSEFPNKRFLNQIITYDFRDKNKRKFAKTNIDNGKIESEGVFEKISDSIYKRISRSEIAELEKLFYFTKDDKLIKTEEKGLFNGAIIKTNLFYYYFQKQYDYIILEKDNKNERLKITYKNSRYDKMKNLIYYELVDANGSQIQKIERNIEYY